MKNPRLRIATIAVLVPSLLGLGSITATAGSPNCQRTFACWWTGTSFTGTHYGSAKNQASWPSGIANKDKSVHNNGTSGNAVYTYRYGNMIETMYCVRSGSTRASIPADKANRGSSHNWKAASTACY